MQRRTELCVGDTLVLEYFFVTRDGDENMHIYIFLIHRSALSKSVSTCYFAS